MAEKPNISGATTEWAPIAMIISGTELAADFALEVELDHRRGRMREARQAAASDLELARKLTHERALEADDAGMVDRDEPRPVRRRGPRQWRRKGRSS